MRCPARCRQPPQNEKPSGVKLIVLVKRAAGMPLADFRSYSLHHYSQQVMRLPGLRRYVQCHTRDGAYGIGEAVLDAAYLHWFDDVDSMYAALESMQGKVAETDLMSFTEHRYIHRMVTAEHWIIGPEPR